MNRTVLQCGVTWSMSRYNKLFYILNDKQYLKLRYWATLGEKLNLDEPKTFNEKIQWLKLNDRNPEYTKMVDKYGAKEYVASKIGRKYIIPTLKVWRNVDDINFDLLPNQFVLKCTHNSGGVIICRDKNKLDINTTKRILNKSLTENYYKWGREWPYKNVQPRIICEELIDEDIKDYKFYCFNGTPMYLYVSQGLEDHKTARISFYDMKFEDAPFGRSDYKKFDIKPSRPKNFKLMVEICERLSKDIPFIRVDLYEVNEKIYFSELTFFPCSGYMPFEPKEYDIEMGKLIELPS